MKNLWPKIEPENLSYPVNLLKEQGKYLQRMTKGILTYNINTKILENFSHPEFRTGKAFRTDFYIHAPHINDYKFLLLYIIHDFAHTYPLLIGHFHTEDMSRAYDQKGFERILENTLISPSTQNVINNLYARSGNLNPA